MAAPAERYAQVSETLVNHPKTTRACRSLRIHRLMFVGHMTCLWNWAMKNAPDGNLSRFSARDISDAAMFTDPDNYDSEEDDKAERFVDALVNCRIDEHASGFLEACGDALCIHDWDQYGGRLNEKRSRNAQKVATWRARNGYVTVTDAENNQGVTVTSRARIRSEEKRREAEHSEEKRREENTNTGASAPAASGDVPAIEIAAKNGRASPMQKPAEKEVAEFFRANASNGPEAKKFWNYYQSNGWKVGKNPMKDWHAAARGWIERANEASPPRGSPGELQADDGKLAVVRHAEAIAPSVAAMRAKMGMPPNP